MPRLVADLLHLRCQYVLSGLVISPDVMPSVLGHLCVFLVALWPLQYFCENSQSAVRVCKTLVEWFETEVGTQQGIQYIRRYESLTLKEVWMDKKDTNTEASVQCILFNNLKCAAGIFLLERRQAIRQHENSRWSKQGSMSTVTLSLSLSLSLFLNLPCCQLDRLQLILNSTARAVPKTPRFSHSSPILKSLHWLKIDQRIQYKVLALSLSFSSTKHFNLKNLPITTTFSTFKLTLLLVHLLLSLFDVRHSTLVSK